MAVWLTGAVERHLAASGAAFAPLETGGMLLGWRDGDDRIVTDVVGPGEHALHGRHAFVPDHRWQRQALARAFADSSGDLDYLGDWHTHPGGEPAMSPVDHATLRRIGRRVPGAMTLIAAGGEGVGWRVGAWLHRRRGWLGATADPQDIRIFDKPDAWPGL